MANYADNQGVKTAEELQAAAQTAAQIAADPYGTNTTGSTGTTASFRQRGDTSQKRVNNDTRVRDDANSGTAGANGTTDGMASTMNVADQSQDATAQQQVPAAPLNASWEATRQSVNLNDVRSRVLQSLKPQQGQ